ncbi:MAG: RHS repeat-associated core domain-containing protein [Chlamydiota bacterium]
MKYTIGLLILLQSMVCAREHILSLGDLGSVHYIYDDQILLHIDRRSPSKELMYRHSYTYNADGLVIIESLIGDLGEIVYSESGIIESPYHKEICERDEKQNITRHIQDNIIREYGYNDLNELITEAEPEESCEYNCAGNVIRVGDVYFDYDENNRLVEASSDDYEVTYTYDDTGRRTSKTVNGEQEFYGYFGINDILVVDSSGRIKELRIPGLAPHRDMLRPIAIETPDAIYAPIHDIQSNIVKLIDIKTREVTSLALPDPFGNGLSKDAPTSWIFSGKYYDKEFDVVYFGHRYYSPKLKQWLSPDPAHQTSDLYQYCFNNPFSYCDPDGQFVIFFPLVWAAGVTLTDVIFGTAVVAGVSWAGRQLPPPKGGGLKR